MGNGALLSDLAYFELNQIDSQLEGEYLLSKGKKSDVSETIKNFNHR